MLMDSPVPDIQVALAHDWLVGLRGGEWVLDRLARLYGPTTIHTLVDDGRFLTSAIDACEVVTSSLQRFPAASGRLRRAYLPLMPWAVGRLRVAPCDVLVSTSSAVMKSIRPPDGAAHLCYCHSPARYIWSQRSDYARGSGGRVRSIGLSLVSRPFQRWDRRTADRVDHFLANSAHTATRIRECYGREADVVHPPVRTEFFTPDASTPREEWYLVAGALEPYKRADLAVLAARRAGFRLKVVGAGSQMDTLRRDAGEETEFLGRVSDDELRSLFRRARAMIFPQEEDFGIVAVEAQACGCPVIATARGGALETVTPRSGVFMDQVSEDGLIEAISRLEQLAGDDEINDAECRLSAERFSEDRFDNAIVGHVRALANARS